jgi:hypothetical protein
VLQRWKNWSLNLGKEERAFENKMLMETLGAERGEMKTGWRELL